MGKNCCYRGMVCVGCCIGVEIVAVHFSDQKKLSLCGSVTGLVASNYLLGNLLTIFDQPIKERGK